jgi:hypothetical protein
LDTEKTFKLQTLIDYSKQVVVVQIIEAIHLIFIERGKLEKKLQSIVEIQPNSTCVTFPVTKT